jgi:hypothetical protein
MEQKPAEQYNVIPNAEVLGLGERVPHPSEGGNGQMPTIDDQSRQTAMARAMIENEKQARVQACAAEIDKAIAAILVKHKCAAKFMELREGGQTTRIWLQPVAVDEPMPGG